MRLRHRAAAVAVFLALGPLAATFDGPKDTRSGRLQGLLQRQELDPLRDWDRVETFALEDVLQKAADTYPSATLVATDLPGSFVAFPERTAVGAERGQEIAQLLLSPESYAPWVSACMFSPGVAIRFHRDTKAVDAFVCFHCQELAFQVVGSNHSLLKLSFDPVQERLFDLVRRARPADARLEEVRRAWDEAAERARMDAEAEERWRAAMPLSLRPYWNAMNDVPASDPGSMKTALVAELRDPGQRILTLLEWHGTGAGPWSGFPAYEQVAEDLLLLYSTTELLAAIEGRELTARQIEGAARLFARREFRERGPGDHSELPVGLRVRLLHHSLESDDEDKRGRAKAAFEAR